MIHNTTANYNQKRSFSYFIYAYYSSILAIGSHTPLFVQNSLYTDNHPYVDMSMRYVYMYVYAIKTDYRSRLCSSFLAQAFALANDGQCLVVSKSVSKRFLGQ